MFSKLACDDAASARPSTARCPFLHFNLSQWPCTHLFSPVCMRPCRARVSILPGLICAALLSPTSPSWLLSTTFFKPLDRLVMWFEISMCNCVPSRCNKRAGPHAGARRVAAFASSAVSSSTKAVAAPPPYNVLITGSTKGVGRALAEEHLRQGDSVVICSKTPDAVAAAVAQLAG